MGDDDWDKLTTSVPDDAIIFDNHLSTQKLDERVGSDYANARVTNANGADGIDYVLMSEANIGLTDEEVVVP